MFYSKCFVMHDSKVRVLIKMSIPVTHTHTKKKDEHTHEESKLHDVREKNSEVTSQSDTLKINRAFPVFKNHTLWQHNC